MEKYDPSKKPPKKLKWYDIEALLLSIVWIGIFGGFKASYYYWKTLLLAAFKHPKAFGLAVAKQIQAVHFRKISQMIEKS